MKKLDEPISAVLNFLRKVCGSKTFSGWSWNRARESIEGSGSEQDKNIVRKSPLKTYKGTNSLFRIFCVDIYKKSTMKSLTVERRRVPLRDRLTRSDVKENGVKEDEKKEERRRWLESRANRVANVTNQGTSMKEILTQQSAGFEQSRYTRDTQTPMPSRQNRAEEITPKKNKDREPLTQDSYSTLQQKVKELQLALENKDKEIKSIKQQAEESKTQIDDLKIQLKKKSEELHTTSRRLDGLGLEGRSLTELKNFRIQHQRALDRISDKIKTLEGICKFFLKVTY